MQIQCPNLLVSVHGHLPAVTCELQTAACAVLWFSKFRWCTVPGPVQWGPGTDVDTRMKCSNSTRCDNYRSIRNAIKLTKCQEMLWSKPLWGQFWPNLCYEAGHKWTQPTLQCVDCAVCIGRHNCRHYNWLAAVSVLGCLQNHKNNTSFSFCSWKQN